MALNVFTAVRHLSGLRRDQHDDDFTQRLFSVYTPVLLTITALIITPRQFLSQPITCWPIGTWSSNYVSYAQRKCLISGTYYLPSSENIETFQPNSKEIIGWYPYTPIFIVFNIVPFIIPSMIWMACNSQGGIEVSKANEAAIMYQNSIDSQTTEEKESILHYIVENLNIVQQIKDSIKVNGKKSKFREACACCMMPRYSSFLSNLTLVVKVLYLLAVIINVIFTAIFIGPGFITLGIKFLTRITAGESVFFPEIFPISSLCIFSVHGSSQIQNIRLQCLLNMNIFIEKVFLVIWYWYALIFTVGAINLTTWILFRFNNRYRYSRFKTYLPFPHTKSDEAKILRFVSSYIGTDCATALRLMAGHLDHLTMTHLCSGLYQMYLTDLNNQTMGEQNDNPNDVISDDEIAFIDKDKMDIAANGF
ncbi:MAG: hypothetical protein MHPSP_000383 [Paramarteilia canceri]